MRKLILGLSALLLCAPMLAQPQASPAKPATLMQGVGDIHHPVSTTNAEAQKFFDQGLALIYAFNHDEAERSFQRAADLDPKLGMAYWGMALAVGPNYNLPVDATREKQAYDAIQKAIKLGTSAPPNERDYIAALARRYTNQPKPNYQQLAVDYRVAMRELAKKYPDDLDAQTLYAESAMNLNPWNLWKPDGTPGEDTQEITAVLESVIRRNPQHTGAVHYYIHTVEASPTPERALAGASRLAELAPAAGHLVHMPAHIYIRTGYYEAAAKSNVDAAAADQNYLKASGAQGVYPMMYYSHNLHFLAYARGMEGRYQDAQRAAGQLKAHVGPHIKAVPMLEPFLNAPLFIDVQFHRWDDILKLPKPDESMKVHSALWHYARGMALASTGKTQQAEAERKALNDIKVTVPAEAVYFGPVINKAVSILEVADKELGSKIAWAENDHKAAIQLLQQAVDVQDTLAYGEPPDWFFPVREFLGAALLMDGDYKQAEQVFRADLQRNPRNGRSLFGLSQALKGQGNTYAAQMVEREYQAAWKTADVPLKVEDLS
jgi:tetratricopeptide (TPR) repeat protein